MDESFAHRACHSVGHAPKLKLNSVSLKDPRHLTRFVETPDGGSADVLHRRAGHEEIAYARRSCAHAPLHVLPVERVITSGLLCEAPQLSRLKQRRSTARIVVLHRTLCGAVELNQIRKAVDKFEPCAVGFFCAPRAG